MPKMIQVRNVPEETHSELRSRAAAEGLSLSQYVLGILNKASSRPRLEDVFQRAANRPISLDAETVVGAVRSNRDRASDAV